MKLGIYRHFKGNNYLVLGVARDCEDPNKQLVTYVALYDSEEFGQNQLWTRDLEDFESIKEKSDGTKVQRFTLIKELPDLLNPLLKK